MTTTTAKARRVTIYKARDGWRYRVQSGNWQIIAASEEGRTSKSRLVARLRREYPGVELVEKS